MEEKIWDLINTGDAVNIKLAVELCKGNDIKLELFDKIYNWDLLEDENLGCLIKTFAYQIDNLSETEHIEEDVFIVNIGIDECVNLNTNKNNQAYLLAIYLNGLADELLDDDRRYYNQFSKLDFTDIFDNYRIIIGGDRSELSIDYKFLNKVKEL